MIHNHYTYIATFYNSRLRIIHICAKYVIHIACPIHNVHILKPDILTQFQENEIEFHGNVIEFQGDKIEFWEMK